MKLVLSIFEVNEIVRNHLGLRTTVDVVILTSNPGPAPSLLETCLRRAFDEAEAPPGFNLKIARIKLFRELVGRRFDPSAGRDLPIVGLTDAKWAVENFDDAIKNIRLFGVIKP